MTPFLDRPRHSLAVWAAASLLSSAAAETTYATGPRLMSPDLKSAFAAARYAIHPSGGRLRADNDANGPSGRDP
jgi:hypothetical protein